MFLISELQEVLALEECQSDISVLRQALVESRLGKPPRFPLGTAGRLSHFVEAILSSAPAWDGDARRDLCQVAGEAAELLAREASEDAAGARHRLRSMLLYELAQLPAMAAGVASASPSRGLVGDFFGHRNVFSELSEAVPSPNGELGILALVSKVIQSDVLGLAQFQRGQPNGHDQWNTDLLRRIALHFEVGWSSTEIAALLEVLSIRKQRAVRSNLPDDLFRSLLQYDFPVELFPAQIDALDAGLLESAFEGWGFAAPTGTGKTFLARLLILNVLRDNPDKGVIYLVPSRALVHEVTSSLQRFFSREGVAVVAVTPQLVSLDSSESQRLEGADVAVLTPEKADLLLRLGSSLLDRCQLVVVDEAHHLEAGTRGALLELYLVRLKHLIRPSPRVVMLSAVTPNIRELAAWAGGKKVGGTTSPHRATRMRPGVFRIKKESGRRRGWVDYADGTSVQLVDGTLKTGRNLIAQVCEAFKVSGPVLVVAKGKRECENLADTLVAARIETAASAVSESSGVRDTLLARLDSRLRREMYADVPMRKYLDQRVAYHHAGLPPRVRAAVEEAIRGGLIDIVFATTTLAEGVNFPFSTVLVQSLALKEAPEKGRPPRYHPITPRSFWNIAGRAGRPGIDHEGQAILFEPTLGLEKVGAVLGPYMDPGLLKLAPVQSALKAAVGRIQTEVSAGRLDLADLQEPVLPNGLSRGTLGAVNLVRVAVAHGAAGDRHVSPEEIVSGTLAFSQSGADEQRFLIDLFASQGGVLDTFFAQPGAPDPLTVAELGLSIDTLTQLSEYVRSLQDWQLKKLREVMRGGHVNLSQAAFVLGPVAKRMGELEGRILGGLYGEVAGHWISGAPLHEIRRSSKGEWTRLEELISVIYSRVQFLLPWGLYAFDRIVEAEAKLRSIPYDNEIKFLAYLADAGVPSFDALRLVDFDFERVDAGRLATAYRGAGGLETGLDIVGWIRATPYEQLARAVRGKDDRELDYDFRSCLDALA